MIDICLAALLFAALGLAFGYYFGYNYPKRESCSEAYDSGWNNCNRAWKVRPPITICANCTEMEQKAKDAYARGIGDSHAQLLDAMKKYPETYHKLIDDIPGMIKKGKRKFARMTRRPL